MVLNISVHFTRPLTSNTSTVQPVHKRKKSTISAGALLARQYLSMRHTSLPFLFKKNVHGFIQRNGKVFFFENDVSQQIMVILRLHPKTVNIIFLNSVTSNQCFNYQVICFTLILLLLYLCRYSSLEMIYLHSPESQA